MAGHRERIFERAYDLGVPASELLRFLRDLGFRVRTEATPMPELEEVFNETLKVWAKDHKQRKPLIRRLRKRQ